MTPAPLAGARVLRAAVLERLGVPHAFSTRVGGVSSGVFASLNFGNPGDIPAERRDPAANIRENYRRLLEAAGGAGREVVEVHQVHGGVVHVVPRPGRARAGGTPAPQGVKADAIVSDDPGLALAVRVADCAPVLLASRDGRVVAAAHAGWRGVIAGVAPAAIGAMRELGAGEIVGAIGPCIGMDAFEVGPEVAAEFRAAFGGAAPVRPGAGDRSHVDIRRAIALQLEACGVRGVDVSAHCTVRDADLFFSHRRERGMTGRMAAVIAARGGG